jgi:hypothetical protein
MVGQSHSIPQIENHQSHQAAPKLIDAATESSTVATTADGLGQDR